MTNGKSATEKMSTERDGFGTTEDLPHVDASSALVTSKGSLGYGVEWKGVGLAE